jgi:hypothetical protein
MVAVPKAVMARAHHHGLDRAKWRQLADINLHEPLKAAIL